MRKIVVLAALFASAAFAQPAPIDAVDPMIGTGGEGHTFPGATAPFGMVQLSPDTDTGCELRACYSHAAGYRYEDPTIQGFSHTHFSGAGHSDLGDVLVMPQAGAAVQLDPGDPKVPNSGYRSRFDHATEVAHPGYYAVTLADSGVRAELTAGTRVGVHRTASPRDRRRTSSSTCARRSTITLARSCGLACTCGPTGSLPASARRAAGHRGGSCISQCASLRR